MKSVIIIILCIALMWHSGILLRASEIEPDEITVLAVGDITIGSSLTPIIERQGAGVFFEGTASIIQSADVATVSLNASISDRGDPSIIQQHHFRAAPGLARALANAGFDAVSLASPNILDFGIVALEDTVTNLAWYNVKSMGAGVSPAAANLPAWINVKDHKVALFAYLRGNEFNMASLNVVASAAYSQMIHAVKQVKNEAELIIVWLHWGKREAKKETRQASIGRQRLFAKALIDAGTDIVLCQQLHTLGGIEIYKGKPIIYSLADFIYDTYELQHVRTIIPKATFKEGVLKSIEIIPILTNKKGVSIPQPSLLKTNDTNASSTHDVLEQTAVETLQKYKKLCAALDTEVIIEGERGWIRSVNNDNTTVVNED